MKEEKILILNDKNGKYWEVPGGRVDGNERFDETLAREHREEIGYEGRIVRSKLVFADRLFKDINQQDTSLALLFYRVVLPDLKKIKLSNEHTEYIWVGKRAALNKVAPEFRIAVSKAWEVQGFGK